MAVMKQVKSNDKKLAEILSRLRKAYRPGRVHLFGSIARGEAGPNSGYDLMAVVSDDAPARQRGSRLAYEKRWGSGAASDILVWTHSAFEGRTRAKASLPAALLREGALFTANTQGMMDE